MGKQYTKAQQQIIYRVYRTICFSIAVICLGLGFLAVWANRFTLNMVTTELTAQKIYFPEKGSPALDPAVYPDLQQYAGQLVDTPAKAEAYANGYIGRHLANVADGKVYSEISTEARKDPTNQELQKQKESLFQGETLRGILLATGYGFGTLGIIAGYAAYVLFAVAAGMFVVVIVLNGRLRA